MRTNSTSFTTAALLAILLFTSSLFARDHDALNGTWTLAPSQSDFGGQSVVQTGTVTIHDRDGVIVIERKFVYEGATETYFYSDSIDSENNDTIHSSKTLKTKTKWDRDVLNVTTTQSGAVTVERYSLATDGTMTVKVERPDHKPILLSFMRK
jgi:hypothetical protein